jgi:UDP-N-acetylmuramyl pentapeptide phosphotransferase/UDP-N-acetylglucosamine-1-phosphate transferase
MIEYLLLLLLLFFLSLLYFKIADKYNIIDKPNHRSAHTEITLRGGGIIFWFSALLYFLQNFQSSALFFIGISIMCLVSFWDDIQSLPNKVRLVAHFVAISIVFYQLDLYHLWPILVVGVAYVFFVGIINAYNFMDGINGITGVYSVVVLGSLLYVNKFVVPFINEDFLIYPILANLVFLFFNFRKKAKCFAGDIGSIGIAFWILYAIIVLMLKTNSFVWILFLAVYGADSVYTIIHRLCLKENIFEAHRHHYYQILSNDLKIQHRLVSLLYGFLQILVSVFVILLYGEINLFLLFSITCFPLLFLYLTKFYWLKKLKL